MAWTSRRLARRPAGLRRRIQLMFQDPYSSLDPRRTVGDTLGEVLVARTPPPWRSRGPGRTGRRPARHGRARARARAQLPHMSGGQRQRVGIARALAVEPRVLLDEPVSALDVSVRAEIMNLLVRLRDQLGLSYVFISHDVAMVRHLSDRVAVMYLGRVVETGSWKAVVDGNSLHPYTQSAPGRGAGARPTGHATHRADGQGRGRRRPGDEGVGCAFAPRCPLVEGGVPARSNPHTAGRRTWWHAMRVRGWAAGRGRGGQGGRGGAAGASTAAADGSGRRGRGGVAARDRPA
ncbi:MAG: ATP-binding cassette domain-containing protein [Chloroflexota bacterium]